MYSRVPRFVLARIGWLLLGLAVVFVAAWAGLDLLMRNATKEILAHEAEEHGELIDAFLKVSGRPLRLFVESYSRRTTFTRPELEPRAASPASTLRTGLRTYELSQGWVLENDGSIRLAVTGEDEDVQIGPPVSPAQLAKIDLPRVHFFKLENNTLYEIRGHRLSVNSTQPGVAPGWVFASMRWSPELLKSTSLLPIDGNKSLVLPAGVDAPSLPNLTIRTQRPLLGLDGSPVMFLRLDYQPEEIEIFRAISRHQLTIMAALSVLCLAILGFSLWRWVLLPAGLMQRCLSERDPEILAPMIAEGGYLEKLARLLRELLETQRQLQITLEERAKLGRELHDGVIQTVYAVGVGLSGLHSTLRSDPARAERVIAETSAELNATIIDLRGFINGLEAGDEPRRPLSETVKAITNLMRIVRPVEFSIEIDDALAEACSAATRLHLMQMIREATSNSVRHGNATRITIRFCRVPKGALLEVSDNGHGFDVTDAGNFGHGLANLRARAHELDASIDIQSTRDGGTLVTVLATVG